MKIKNTRRGFTLIELLVVVIIIAILAAIALPQYNKAVMKARTADIQTFMAHVEKAMDLYVLENGYSSSVKYIPWDEMGIDVSSYCDSIGAVNIGYPCTAKNFQANAPSLYSNGFWQMDVALSESAFGLSMIHIYGYKNGSKEKKCYVYSLKAKPLCEALKASDSSWVVELDSTL